MSYAETEPPRMAMNRSASGLAQSSVFRGQLPSIKAAENADGVQ